MAVRPVALNAAIACLFIIGSSLFALGTVPAYVNAVGETADSVTYFAGSHLFHVGLIRPTRAGPDTGDDRGRRRLAAHAGAGSIQGVAAT